MLTGKLWTLPHLIVFNCNLFLSSATKTLSSALIMRIYLTTCKLFISSLFTSSSFTGLVYSHASLPFPRNSKPLLLKRGNKSLNLTHSCYNIVSNTLSGSYCHQDIDHAFYTWVLLYFVCFLTCDSSTYKPKIPFQSISILFHSIPNTPFNTALFFNSINVLLTDRMSEKKVFSWILHKFGSTIQTGSTERLLAILHSKEVICPVTANVLSHLQRLNFSSSFSVPSTREVFKVI